MKTLDDLVPVDPLMALAWHNCLHWAIGEEKILESFRKASGVNYRPPANMLEKLIDESCGNDGFEFLRAFVIWFNVNIWGDINESAT